MDFLNRITSVLIGGPLARLAGHNAMLSLVPISILMGIVMLWVFGRTSNQAAIRRAKNRLQAHLYELRLFTDEPRLVWQAQRGLLAANLRYIGLMLVPALVLTVPMVLVFAQLESFYGLAPLPPGRDALLTMHLSGPLDPQAPPPVLQVPAGIAVESPAVRVLGEREVSWRIRPLRSVSGVIRVLLPGAVVEKTIQAGASPQYVSGRRVSALSDLIWHPAERRLPDGPVDWIEIQYPAASVHWLGLDLHWLIWLMLLSMLTALALKRRFKVSF